MKKFACVLLCTIFTILITSSIQYASADHSLGGNGIFKDENTANLVSSEGSKYTKYLEIRLLQFLRDMNIRKNFYEV